MTRVLVKKFITGFCIGFAIGCVTRYGYRAYREHGPQWEGVEPQVQRFFGVSS